MISGATSYVVLAASLAATVCLADITCSPRPRATVTLHSIGTQVPPRRFTIQLSAHDTQRARRRLNLPLNERKLSGMDPTNLVTPITPWSTNGSDPAEGTGDRARVKSRVKRAKAPTKKPVGGGGPIGFTYPNGHDKPTASVAKVTKDPVMNETTSHESNPTHKSDDSAIGVTMTTSMTTAAINNTTNTAISDITTSAAATATSATTDSATTNGTAAVATATATATSAAIAAATEAATAAGTYAAIVAATPITITKTQTPQNIWLYGAPILLVSGTVGNALAVVVMTRKELRKATTCLFLTVLAFVDTAILYTGLGRQWLIVYEGTDVRKSSAFMCKAHSFFLYGLAQYQAWLLVTVTIERLIAVFLPHHSKRLCTRPNAIAAMVTVAVLISSLNAHFFWTNEYMHFEFMTYSVSRCASLKQSYIRFRRAVWPWVDLFSFSVLPFTVLVSSNIAILLRMLYSHYVRSTSLHTHGNAVKMTSMTAILITISFSFFLTTAPICIYLIVHDSLRNGSEVKQDTDMSIIWAAINLLTYVNNTINFLLYCVSGSRFRKELISIFRRHKNRIKPANYSGTMELSNNPAGVTMTTAQTGRTNLLGSPSRQSSVAPAPQRTTTNN